MITIFDPSCNLLELYDISPDGDPLSSSSVSQGQGQGQGPTLSPLFVYHLGPTKLLYFTERFIFTVPIYPSQSQRQQQQQPPSVLN